MRNEHVLSLQVICFCLSSPMAGVAQTRGPDAPVSIVDRHKENSGLTFGIKFSDQMLPEASVSGTWRPRADFYITALITGDVGAGPVVVPHMLAFGLYHQPDLNTLIGLEVDANLGEGGDAGARATLSWSGSLDAMVLSTSVAAGYHDQLGWSLDAQTRVDFPLGDTAFGFAEGWLSNGGTFRYGVAVGAAIAVSDQSEITLRYFQEGGDASTIGFSSEVLLEIDHQLSTTFEASWMRDQAEQIDSVSLIAAADWTLTGATTASLSAEAHLADGNFESAALRIDVAVERNDGELIFFAEKGLGSSSSTGFGVGWTLRW